MFKYMWAELKTMIKTITPAQAATHELLHAEHDLLKAEAGVEYAQAMVTCQKQRIKRLKAYLAAEEPKELA
jgi:hypothetical protein